MRDSANKMTPVLDHAIRTMDTVHPTQCPHLRNAFSVTLCLMLHRFAYQRCTLLVDLYIHTCIVCVCMCGREGANTINRATI